ncbi:hypothetical protein EBZ39_01455 [bacterium]|nr:hypothetical protein [bacterium]
MNKFAQQVTPPEVFGGDLLRSALTGASITAAGAGLYHLLNSAQSAKIPDLIQDKAPQSVAPKKNPAKKLKKTQKTAKAGATNSSFGDQALTWLAGIVPKENPLALLSRIPLGRHADRTYPTAWHEGYQNTANIAFGVGGGLAALSAIRALTDKKKKEDLADSVNDARKEYFDALTGKSAAALDAAFDALKTTPAEKRATTLTGQAWNALMLSALGTGAIGAKYTYDQTVARSRAATLQRAAAARARLRALQSAPYVDPEQLTALVENSKK